MRFLSKKVNFFLDIMNVHLVGHKGDIVDKSLKSGYKLVRKRHHKVYSRLTSKQRLGFAAENLALWHLKQKGYEVLARRWSCPQGEIDLIMWHPRELAIAFVEVKALSAQSHHQAEEAVDRSKQKKLAKTANIWRLKNGEVPAFYRFDVISIYCPKGSSPRIRHYLHAFNSEFFSY